MVIAQKHPPLAQRPMRRLSVQSANGQIAFGTATMGLITPQAGQAVRGQRHKPHPEVI
jgi:hypothetical protein